ncbi:MAG: hypothetical protein E7478_02060 [Ruminococcaceae bacterium]|nr:hypothetical protein [Oscillospiraceae bacterium]
MANIRSRVFAAAASLMMGMSLLTACGGDDASSTVATTTGSTDASAPDVQTEVVDTGWTYGQVAVGGGGFVTGVFSTCEEGVYYARTDVGGAYRWDNEKQAWKSLNYWVSEDDVGLMGISAIAVDPTNAANVYLLAGTEYFSSGKTCILKSTDYGENFTVVDVTNLIKVHGNCMGRGNGERMAVDPNNPNIIFAGGNTGGMIKSTDGGLSWSPVSSFPVTHTQNGNGINIIVFDPATAKDGVTQRIYATASQKTDSFFVSEDGGATWNPVANAYEGMAQRIKLDSKGNLFVAYGDKEGPWNQNVGGIYKYDMTNGTVESIAPTNRPYGDIVIDPNDENRMVIVTTQTWMQQPNGSHGDVFYTTTDGGKTWNDLLKTMKMSTNGMDWVEGYAIHWCCSLSMNPFDTDEIMVTSGNGIFACDNVFDAEPEFYFNSMGIEETVPMDIITLEDYPLVSSVLDYDGFVHEDITVPAVTHGGNIGAVTSITIAPQNRDYWAKVGGSDSGMAFNYSTDGGKNWSSIPTPPEAGKVYHSGHIAFNADGSRLIWSPANAYNAYYTEDLGKTWTPCEGIMGQGLYVIGDSVDPNYVYAYGGEKLYVSSDGGKSFTKTGTDLFLSQDRLCVHPTAAGTFYVPAINLYMTTDFGATFTKVENVKTCEAVSLGKAKKEGDPYVIYIYGTVADNDAKGIYMSEDNGATWTRCNDDAHRFGGTGNGGWISGDLNVYGRVYMSTVGLGICYCDKTEK